ncbi:hypothetical protein K144316041_p20500 (plasmid) [Clostridium tetani]|uniref:hypothetical protein n=1 Tax=Clostridium tetani TaxID=1513 RepID=UPI002952CAE4|nr:hypothetical protein [Clostridium tetani]BDR74211.1 hypothetical protein K144316041_p20500 [Clostridium tetani]
MDFNNFFTLEYMLTPVGATTTTILIVQFLKEMPLLKQMRTKYLAFIVALLNILICTFLTKGINCNDLYMIFINSLIIGFSSVGGYDFNNKILRTDKLEIKDDKDEQI